MRIIRKPAKRNFSTIRKPIIRKTSRKVFSKRNFANISQEMLDAIEEAMSDGMRNHYEPFAYVGELNKETENGIIRLNTFSTIEALEALSFPPSVSNIGQENIIKEAETKATNKELKRIYSAENMADWLNWDVIAEDYDIDSDKLKQLWIKDKLDYDENPELVEEIEDAFRSDEQPNLMDLTVILNTNKDTADVYLDVNQYNGVHGDNVYHSIIDLTGNEKVDTQNICNAIANACSCF